MNELKREFYQINNNAPDVDLEKRILRNVVIATKRLASDGWIILPDGIDTSDYLKNPIVTARHAEQNILGADPVVVGRALELSKTATELTGSIQFAMTGKGWEYAYLYGLNENKEVYMRAWSVRTEVIERVEWTFGQARAELGLLFDEDMATKISRNQSVVKVATRSKLLAFSPVEIGADKGALTRAAQAGNGAAVELVRMMETQDSKPVLNELQKILICSELERINQQIQASSCNGTDAAGTGNSSELLNELTKLHKELKG